MGQEIFWGKYAEYPYRHILQKKSKKVFIHSNMM